MIHSEFNRRRLEKLGEPGPLLPRVGHREETLMSQFWGFHVRFRKLFVFKKKLRIRSNVYCKSCWSNFQFFIAALQALYHQVTASTKKLLLMC
ncbi:uncharacterized protein [Malus domestica]|uniref:uncharacterized protein isoform X2 n=1 Tax=Malus domestica TaxID=3750 RepID=UPI00397636C8